MFIIEGSDCLGKTTVANKIVKMMSESVYPVRYEHMTRPNKNFDFFYDYKDMMSKYAVMDRFHMGGQVYHDAISTARMRIIEGWLQGLGSYTVLLYASDDEWYRDHLRECLGDGRKEMFEIDKIIKYNRKFKRIAQDRIGSEPRFDGVWNVCGGYASDHVITAWTKQWSECLNLLPRNSNVI